MTPTTSLAANPNFKIFLDLLESHLKGYKERVGFTFFEKYAVAFKEGQKYTKIFTVEVTSSGEQRRSITAFIDNETGDILKPAGYGVPAKHARGNINSDRYGMEAFNESCFVRYLK
jgi:hypothetical protein